MLPEGHGPSDAICPEQCSGAIPLLYLPLSSTVVSKRLEGRSAVARCRSGVLGKGVEQPQYRGEAVQK